MTKKKIANHPRYWTPLTGIKRELAHLRMVCKMQGDTIEVLNRTIGQLNETIINLVAGRGG